MYKQDLAFLALINITLMLEDVFTPVVVFFPGARAARAVVLGPLDSYNMPWILSKNCSKLTVNDIKAFS